jgi:hypothetical protein
LEAVLRVLRREVRDRRLRSDNELEFGDQVDDELTVRAHRLANAVAPAGDLAACPRFGNRLLAMVCVLTKLSTSSQLQASKKTFVCATKSSGYWNSAP